MKLQYEKVENDKWQPSIHRRGFEFILDESFDDKNVALKAVFEKFGPFFCSMVLRKLAEVGVSESFVTTYILPNGWKLEDTKEFVHFAKFHRRISAGLHVDYPALLNGMLLSGFEDTMNNIAYNNYLKFIEENYLKFIEGSNKDG